VRGAPKRLHRHRLRAAQGTASVADPMAIPATLVTTTPNPKIVSQTSPRRSRKTCSGPVFFLEERP
jgi:hypothetical protein